MRLDRQVRASGLEDADDGGHPLEVPFGDDCHDVLRLQTTPVQGAGDPVGAGVQLRVRPLARVLDGRDALRMLPDTLLEQFVEAPLGPGPLGSGQLFQLQPPLLGVDEVGVSGFRLGVADQMAECAQMIASDPPGCVLVEDVEPVAQAQRFACGVAEGQAEDEAFRRVRDRRPDRC